MPKPIANYYYLANTVIAEFDKIAMKLMVGASKGTGNYKLYVIYFHVCDITGKTKKRAGRISL